MRRPSGIDAPSTTRWPRNVLVMAGLFALICFALQVWRLFSLSATYDQALFLQELSICTGGGNCQPRCSATQGSKRVVVPGAMRSHTTSACP